MKNTIKNVALFVGGGATFLWAFSKACLDKAKYPREGSVVYEDNDKKIVRMSAEKGKDYDVAVISYKNHKENEES